MVDFSAVKLGKKQAVFDPRNLRFASYLLPDLGPPPSVVSRTRGLKGWGMLGNDQLGDCTIAAAIHTCQSWRLSLTSEMMQATNEEAIEYYSRWCGYVPGKPDTDQGGVEHDVLKRWRKEGIRLGESYTHNIAAFTEVDYRDLDQVKRCIDLFGAIYLGVALPRSIQTQRIWHPASGNDGIPGSWGLHAVMADNYDSGVILLQTWGEQQEATWSWFLQCCDESWGIVSDTDWASPEGFNRDQLLADLQIVTKMQRAS